MGGQASVATVYIAFDRPFVQAGDHVTGTVHLTVVQEVLSYASIGCRIVGQELTAVTCPLFDSEEDSVAERRRFIDMKFCLRNIPDAVICRGQHGYPFSFTMPASAPASMYTGDLWCYGCIGYAMEVWIDRPGFPPDSLRHKASITVAPTPAVFARSPVIMQPRSFDLQLLSLFDRENVPLCGHAESIVVYAGETTTVKFSAENRSTVRIKAVEVTITEHAKYVVHGYYGTSKRTLFRTRLSPEQMGFQLEASQGQSDQPAALRMTAAINSGHMTADTRFCSVCIPIPLDAASSYQNGGTFQIFHELQIKLMTTFGTCNPWLTQQIYVVNPTPVHSPPAVLRAEGCDPVPQLPPNWTPRIAPVVAIPDVPCDIGAFSRPGANDDHRPPVRYADSVRVAPAGFFTAGYSDHMQQVGFPYAALRNALPQGPTTVPAYAVVQEHNGCAETVVASVHPGHPSAKGTHCMEPTAAAQLVQAARHSFDPCEKLVNFLLAGHSADDLQPDELYTLFNSIPLVATQVRFAATLTRSLTSMTCAKVASITAGATEAGRGQVVQAMLRTGRLADRENAHLIKDQLSPAAWAGTHQYLGKFCSHEMCG
jgi:hypothetical protein